MKVTSRYVRWRNMTSFFTFQLSQCNLFVCVSSYLSEIQVFLHGN